MKINLKKKKHNCHGAFRIIVDEKSIVEMIIGLVMVFFEPTRELSVRKKEKRSWFVLDFRFGLNTIISNQILLANFNLLCALSVRYLANIVVFAIQKLT